MPDLFAKSALAGVAPLVRGGVSLSEALPGRITSVAAWPGGMAGVEAALSGFPAPNRFLEGPLRVWTGPEQCFVVGVEAPELGGLAAVTDQTGGWAALSLKGPGLEALLARLFPIDAAGLAPGHCARTPLNHMQAIVLRLAADEALVLVFRSMARTAWGEMAEAMEMLEARAAAGL